MKLIKEIFAQRGLAIYIPIPFTKKSTLVEVWW